MKLRIMLIAILAVVLCSCGTESTPAATLMPGGPTATATITATEALLTVVPATETPEVISGSVIARSLYVRNGPGMSYLVVGGLVKGDAVEIVGKNADGSWLQIVYEDGRAWVSAQWVDLEE